MPTRRAFTLVEILDTIGVIGVLIAILAPALRGARGTARETVCLANLRTAHADVDAYLGAHRGAYPRLGAGSYDVAPLVNGRFTARLTTSGEWNTHLWPAVMHEVAPWREHFGSWVCPGSPRVPGEPWHGDPDTPGHPGDGVPSYLLSMALTAAPRLWYPDTVVDPENPGEFLRPARDHELRSPAGKVLLYDSEMAHLDPLTPEPLRDARPIGFVDGHAAVLKRSESTEPVPNPLRSGLASRLDDTPRGAHGHDY